MRRAIFGDTFFFLALLDAGDDHHRDALALLPRIERAGLVTTEWVLAEVLDAHAAPNRRLAAARFVESLAGEGAVDIESGSALFSEALALYGRRPDKGWSFTDCASFVHMDRRGLRAAATGDRHFEQAGFQALMR